MSRIKVNKKINPAVLKSELGGVDVFTSEGDSPEAAETIDVIADVDEATLQSAINAHTAPKTPEEERRAAISSARTLEELKLALLGQSHSA